MTTSKAETTVALMGAVTFGSVSVAKLSAGTIPSGRQVAATCIAFAALGALAGVAPDIGAGLAIATGGTAFVAYGLPVILQYFPNTKGTK